ncbi:hypothetical protein HAX54_021566 [Datura stramonium]|uniref:Uncharacterized protein n=1 Tax=Datura stramonium TaxID=4076 RepID=A0ABS8S3N0_DATST|nr:hypothetical protein [Datura stramonium]
MPASCEPKVTAIEEVKQMRTMQMDALIGNLQTYKLKKIDKVAEKPKKKRNLILKADSKFDNEQMTMFVRRFNKFFRKENYEKRKFQNKGNPLRRDSSRDISSVGK